MRPLHRGHQSSNLAGVVAGFALMALGVGGAIGVVLFLLLA